MLPGSGRGAGFAQLNPFAADAPQLRCWEDRAKVVCLHLI
jgi:hypothetical protein